MNIKSEARQIAEMRENTNGATREERIAALAHDIEQFAVVLTPPERATTTTLETARNWLTARHGELQMMIEDCPHGTYQDDLDVVETLLQIVGAHAMPTTDNHLRIENAELSAAIEELQNMQCRSKSKPTV